MIDHNENFDDNSTLPFFIKPQKDPARGQVHFCDNLIEILFEKINIPCKQEFSEVKTKRPILDHYLNDICNITSYYGIFTIEITSPKPNNIKHQIQTNDIDIEFSKVFIDYLKITQHQNSQRENSIFTNDEFSTNYGYLSKLLKRIWIDSN